MKKHPVSLGELLCILAKVNKLTTSSLFSFQRPWVAERRYLLADFAACMMLSLLDLQLHCVCLLEVTDFFVCNQFPCSFQKYML